MEIPQIDDLPGFTKYLGKARTDRIRYAQKGTGRRMACASNITNPIINEMQHEVLQSSSAVADILTGVANADENDRIPLNVNRIYTVLQCMPLINSREIGIMMSISPRQAQRYLRAIKIALPFLIRALKKRAAKEVADEKKEAPSK